MLIPVLIFLLVLTGHFYSPVKGSPDSVWTVQTALSLIRAGDANLDEYAPIIPMNDHRIEVVDDHIYSFFPIGTPLLATPIVFFFDQFSAPLLGVEDLYTYLQRPNTTSMAWPIERFAASVFMALAAVCIYQIARLQLNVSRSLLAAFIFAFGSAAWSLASRGLWQHGPSMLMLALALWIILLAQGRPGLIQFASLPLACAYIIRPTNGLSVLLLTLFIWLEYRPYFWRYCLWAAPLALAFMLYNFSIYGSIISSYYQLAATDQTRTFIRQRGFGESDSVLEAFLAHVISPGRGLFVFSPIFLGSLYGMFWQVKIRPAGKLSSGDRSRAEGNVRAPSQKLDMYLISIIILHWSLISFFPYWWGGATFGARFFSDMTPYFVYFLIPVLALFPQKGDVKGGLYNAALVGLILISFFIHYRGATQQATFGWNDYPKRIEENPGRVWDWRDLQFLRGLFPSPRPLSITPPVLHLAARQGETSEQAVTLTLDNRGDQPYIWTVEGPMRLNFEAQIGGLIQEQTITTKIATAGYQPGEYSLGGIQVTLTSENGRPVKNGLVVVPVSLRVFPAMGQVFLPLVRKNDQTPPADAAKRAGTAGPVADPGQFTPPVDILVAEADQLAALHGKGWYDYEQLDNFTWRWALSPARLLVYSPEAGPVQFASMPVALHDPTQPNGLGQQGTLMVRVNEQKPQALAVVVEQPFAAVINLAAGWNTIDLELAAGNFRPIDFEPATGDPRHLSFSLATISLSAK